MEAQDDRLKPIMTRELARQEVIQAAVAAAEAVLQAYFNEHDSNPDEEAYLQYKTGANLMMKGVASIDQRVFLNDLTGFQVAELKPVLKEPELKIVVIGTCICGRDTLRENDFAVYDPPVCAGCYNVPPDCNCKKLALKR